MSREALLQAKRKLVSADDVTAAWVDVLAALKAKLLALPTKCAPICATEKDIKVIQSVIENQVREALDELSAYQPDEHAGRTTGTNSSSATGDVDVKAATASKRGRVGRPRKAAVIGG